MIRAVIRLIRTAAGFALLLVLLLLGFWLPEPLVRYWAAVLGVAIVALVLYLRTLSGQVEAVVLVEYARRMLTASQSEEGAAAAAAAAERLGARSHPLIVGTVLSGAARVLQQAGYAGPAAALWARYGEGLTLQQRRPEAIRVYRRCLRLLAAVPQAEVSFLLRTTLGNLLALEGRFQESLDEFRRADGLVATLSADEATALPPGAVAAMRMATAEVLYRLGRPDEARSLAEQAVREGGASWPAELQRVAGMIVGVNARRASPSDQSVPHPAPPHLPRLGVVARIRRFLGREDPAVVFTDLWSRAWVALSRGDHSEALRLARRAEPYGRQIGGQALEHLLDGMRGFQAAMQGRWAEALAWLEGMRRGFFDTLAENRQPEGIATRMADWGELFGIGVDAAEKLWRAERQPEALLAGLDFADSARCVIIREGLWRFGSRAEVGDPESWRPTRTDRRALFPWDETNRPSGTAIDIRNLSPPAVPARMLFDMPAPSGASANLPFSASLTRAELLRLLPDAQTVLVMLFIQGTDLLVMPVRRGPDGLPLVLTAEGGYFRVPGVMDSVAQELAQPSPVPGDRPLTLLEEGPIDVTPSGSPPATEASSFERVAIAIRLEEMLTLIEPDPARLSELHLVLLPDGPLYQFPLHACGPVTGPRLYERVASVSYGLSLRTLLHQLPVAAAADHELRGVLFGCSDPNGRFLPGVAQEVERVTAATGAGHWWLHGDAGAAEELATAANLRSRHASGNVLWIAGHGGSFAIPAPTSRLEDAIQLQDGPVGLSRLVADGYSFHRVEVVHLSCCLLGRLSLWEGAREVIGSNAVLALLGARRVCSALWPLDDRAAAAFGAIWAAALKERCFAGSVPGPHGFALAFKDALSAFRRNHASEFGGEQYWAPYVLYGGG